MASSERTARAETNAAAGAETATEARAAEGGAEGDATTQHGARANQRGAAADETPGPLATSEISRLRGSCLMNAHYHAAREAFLDTVHRALMFGVIMFGAAAIADLFPHDANGFPWIKNSFAAGAALFGALDLAFDLSNRARTHSMMKRRYFELLADFRQQEKTFDQAEVCLDRYSSEEEPPYFVLLLTCWNRAQKEVYGSEARQFRIPIRYRIFKNLVRMPTVDFGEPLVLGSGHPPTAGD